MGDETRRSPDSTEEGIAGLREHALETLREKELQRKMNEGHKQASDEHGTTESALEASQRKK